MRDTSKGIEGLRDIIARMRKEADIYERPPVVAHGTTAALRFWVTELEHTIAGTKVGVKGATI
jgi:hypothetical protein